MIHAIHSEEEFAWLLLEFSLCLVLHQDHYPIKRLSVLLLTNFKTHIVKTNVIFHFHKVYNQKVFKAESIKFGQSTLC